MAYDPFPDRPTFLVPVHPVEIDEPLEIVGLEVLRLHVGEALDISLDPGAEDGSRAPSARDRPDLLGWPCSARLRASDPSRRHCAPSYSRGLALSPPRYGLSEPCWCAWPVACCSTAPMNRWPPLRRPCPWTGPSCASRLPRARPWCRRTTSRLSIHVPKGSPGSSSH